MDQENNSAMTLYSDAKKALLKYKTVDEVKEFRDKAFAIEVYAKQACDYDLEKDAAIARIRAERKCGLLLRDMDKAKGNQHINSAKSNGATEHSKTLSEMGVTKDQSSKWQKLANVPEKEFEEAINLPGSVPSVSRFLKKDEPVEQEQRIGLDALWLYGLLKHIDALIAWHKSRETDNVLCPKP